MVVAERVARGRSVDLPAMAPEAIEFLLTPYLGAAAAKAAAIPSAQRPDQDSNLGPTP